jgi:outer membrane protein, heavy metal efflux system
MPSRGLICGRLPAALDHDGSRLPGEIMVRSMLWLTTAMLLTGCAAAAHNEDFAEVQSRAVERIGKRVMWNGHSADDRAVEAAMHDLLARPLTADTAVQAALLNNPKLQADFEELGIAQADLVQAGLLRNPVLDLSVRFPNSAPHKAYLNFGVAESFLDVFLIPARRKIAAGQLKQVKARVTNEVLELAARTASAFYAWQGAAQRVELLGTVGDATNASLDAATRLRKAGNTNELAYLGERAQADRATVDLANARADAADARERVNALMGLADHQLDWTAAGRRLPDVPAGEVRVEGLEATAVRQRQDLAAARSEVLMQARIYGFTVDTRFFASADLGADAERETDGQWRIGPTVALPIPLFDQGQGSIPRARAVLQQSRQRYAALALDIRSQVRAARARLLNARSTAQFYRDEILPTQQRLLEQTQLQYNGMFVGVFQLLQAKRDEIDAAVQYVNALQSYWTARAELERAIGGRLPVGAPATMPATQPAGARPTAPASGSARPHNHGEHP